MRGEFLIVIEKADDGESYFAYCPEVMEARAESNTLDGCRARMREAIKEVLDKHLEEGLREVPQDAIRETIIVESPREEIAKRVTHEAHG